ncbi:hypothetical protein F3Y22_tig00111069pilonHSYRG00039 [Hibiscus syriacus]|uniref:Uncharacterized protein n=2 Tax=Hibiscus syriacus TaxID=106335 RepID=A0A6A2Z2Z2_HIBSY|nr:hypothetical protein F3Y22_tig00111069pilonHSYRG00039 [Hibiscus syriacus]
MRPTIFDEKVADALKNWHQTAKEQVKQGKNSENTTPFSSRPATPTRGTSPVHLLHRYPERSVDSSRTSPSHSDFENNIWDLADSFADSPNRRDTDVPAADHGRLQLQTSEVADTAVRESSTSEFVSRSPGSVRTQHTIEITPSNFSFPKR